MPLEDSDNAVGEREERHVVRAKRMPKERSADKVASHNVTREPSLLGVVVV